MLTVSVLLPIFKPQLTGEKEMNTEQSAMAVQAEKFAFADRESCCSLPLEAQWQVCDRLQPDPAHQANGRFGREPASCQRQQSAPRPKPTSGV